jgi:hypothetical protein
MPHDASHISKRGISMGSYQFRVELNLDKLKGFVKGAEKKIKRGIAAAEQAVNEATAPAKDTKAYIDAAAAYHTVIAAKAGALGIKKEDIALDAFGYAANPGLDLKDAKIGPLAENMTAKALAVVDRLFREDKAGVDTHIKAEAIDAQISRGLKEKGITLPKESPTIHARVDAGFQVQAEIQKLGARTTAKRPQGTPIPKGDVAQHKL